MSVIFWRFRLHYPLGLPPRAEFRAGGLFTTGAVRTKLPVDGLATTASGNISTAPIS